MIKHWIDYTLETTGKWWWVAMFWIQWWTCDKVALKNVDYHWRKCPHTHPPQFKQPQGRCTAKYVFAHMHESKHICVCSSQGKGGVGWGGVGFGQSTILGQVVVGKKTQRETTVTLRMKRWCQWTKNRKCASQHLLDLCGRVSCLSYQIGRPVAYNQLQTVKAPRNLDAFKLSTDSQSCSETQRQVWHGKRFLRTLQYKHKT